MTYYRNLPEWGLCHACGNQTASGVCCAWGGCFFAPGASMNLQSQWKPKKPKAKPEDVVGDYPGDKPRSEPHQVVEQAREKARAHRGEPEEMTRTESPMGESLGWVHAADATGRKGVSVIRGPRAFPKSTGIPLPTPQPGEGYVLMIVPTLRRGERSGQLGVALVTRRAKAGFMVGFDGWPSRLRHDEELVVEWLIAKDAPKREEKAADPTKTTGAPYWPSGKNPWGEEMPRAHGCCAHCKRHRQNLPPGTVNACCVYRYCVFGQGGRPRDYWFPRECESGVIREVMTRTPPVNVRCETINDPPPDASCGNCANHDGTGAKNEPHRSCNESYKNGGPRTGWRAK